MPSDSPRPRLRDLALPLVLFALVVLLWLPSGLNLPPTEDDWNFYALWDQVAAEQQPLPLYPGRPLMMLTWAIPYGLSSESMLAVNWLIALLLLVRAAAFFAIVRHLCGRWTWAAAAACLLLVIPIDYGVYNRGNFNAHLITTLYTLAAALFLRFALRLRGTAIAAIWSLLGITCSLYESVYPLIALTPLALFIRERRLSRPLMTASLIWWAVPALCVVVFLLPSLRTDSSYQSNLVRSDLSLGALLHTTGEVYLFALVRLWYAALRQEVGGWLIVRTAAGALVAASIWAGAQRERLASWQNGAGAFTMSLIIIGAGCAVYLPTTLIGDGGGTRVHFLTAGGAALAAALIMWAVGRLVRTYAVFALGVGVLVTLGLGGMYSLIHAGTYDMALSQKRLLHSFVTTAPGLAPHTTLILVFDADAINPFPQGYDTYPTNALRYLYQDITLNVRTCVSDCAPQMWRDAAAAQSLVLRVDADLRVTPVAEIRTWGLAYKPQMRFNTNAPAPPRFTTLYGAPP